MLMMLELAFLVLPALGNPECQQNDLLNRLLLRVLLSSMVTTTTQNPLMENLNRLFNINPSSAASPTTVVTSTAISTITQLFSTIVNVRRIADSCPNLNRKTDGHSLI